METLTDVIPAGHVQLEIPPTSNCSQIPLDELELLLLESVELEEDNVLVLEELSVLVLLELDDDERVLVEELDRLELLLLESVLSDDNDDRLDSVLVLLDDRVDVDEEELTSAPLWLLRLESLDSVLELEEESVDVLLELSVLVEDSLLRLESVDVLELETVEVLDELRVLVLLSEDKLDSVDVLLLDNVLVLLLDTLLVLEEDRLLVDDEDELSSPAVLSRSGPSDSQTTRWPDSLNGPPGSQINIVPPSGGYATRSSGLT